MWNRGAVLLGVWLAIFGAGMRPAAGQKLLPSPGPRTCGTQAADDWQQAQLKRRLPGYSAAKLAGAPTQLALRTAAVTYTLPVVVHIIHNGEAVGAGTNLSQAQVQSQIDALNEDYRNLNADGALVPGPFQPLRADAQFQFALATRDPSGNTMAEPGIDRVSRAAQGFAAPPYSQTYIDSTIKPGTDWNPAQYVNIWVLDLGGRLLGYAQFPDNTANLAGLSPLGGLAATDGVVILYSAFGRVGTLSPPYDRGRSLTHELGHWLGLRHIWGDSDCGDDYCADTPTQQTSNIGCPSFPHVTCSNGPNGDMFMNYMDYSNDGCMHMFSADQKARMQAVMAVGTARRASLLTSPAFCPNVLSASAANSGATCPGGSVRLTAAGPAGASYLWNGPNGYTSTQQNPTLTGLTAAQAGQYTVTISDNSGACPGAARTTVVVSPAPPKPVLTPQAAAVCAGGQVTLATTNLTVAPGALPNENFNGNAPGWTLANAGLASTAWQYRPAPFTYNSSYVALTAYSLDGSQFALANSDIGDNGSSTNTTLTSPVFSTAGYGALQVAFQQYYRNDPGDQATVEVSTDGGTSWATLATYAADQGTAAAPATATLDLGAYLNQPRVQLRWHYVASWGFFWALDNVVVTGTPAAFTYAWTLVSGNGLPAATNTPTLVVTPTQSSVYRLTVSSPGLSCTASDTVGVRLVTPTWTGAAGNGNWFDATNWAGCVPTRTTDALIPAGRSTYPTIGSGTAEVRTLTQQGGLTLAGGQLALYGDYLGTGPLTHTGGTVATLGTGPQRLRAATYQTLLIAGTGPKVIEAATINQALTLAGPVLSTGSTALILAPTATLSETDASYVLGQVQTTRLLGTTPDDFGGLGLTLAPASAPGATTVLRTTGQPQGTAGAGSISRYFDITAATSRGLLGTLITQHYLPHELNDLTESQLVAFRSITNGATWTNEGATQRDATAQTVARAYVTDLQGRWTLASPTAPLAPAPVTYAINAFPVPFGGDGLSIQVTTPTAGPLTVQLYDVLGRVIYNHAVANVEVGTSTVSLPGSGQLLAAKYILVVQQAAQTARLNVVKQ